MARIEEWLSGYVLHTRPFRETSVIAEIFTKECGVVSVVCRGVNGNSKANKSIKAKLQPFQPIACLWRGDRELKTGKQFESNGAGFFFTGPVLYSALYLNELLLRLLYKEDAHPNLYQFYQDTLQQLTDINVGTELDQNAAIEVLLRRFELSLLAETGYELGLNTDADYNAIEPNKYYRYDPEQGFVPSLKKIAPNAKQAIFNGEHLLAIFQEEWQHAEVRQAAKRLMRLALAPHLGNKPLKSRELFLKISSEKSSVKS